MASDAAARSPLETVLPEYEIQGELGRGAMGVVLAARHRSLHRDVAIKELPPSFAVDETVRQRFLHEAQTLASLNHPHVVQVFDFIDRNGHLALVMERLPGGTVWQRFTGLGVSAPTACGLILAAAAGLDHAHRHGVLHRDIKPENLMFTGQGWLKVTDFGIAKVMGGERTLATMEGAILGTPAYMAPEQAEGLTVGPPADVYACGTILYEMLSGQLPFALAATPMATLVARIRDEPPSLATRSARVPLPIADVVDRSIARAIEDRYPTVEDFAVALGQAAAGTWGSNWLAATGLTVAGSDAIEWALRTPRPGGGGTMGVAVADVEAEVAAFSQRGPAPDTLLDRQHPGVIDFSRQGPGDFRQVNPMAHHTPPQPGRFRPLLAALVAVALAGLTAALAISGPDLLGVPGRREIDFSQRFDVVGAAPGDEVTVHLSVLGLPVGRVSQTVGRDYKIEPGYVRWTAAGLLDATIEIGGSEPYDEKVQAVQPWLTTAPTIAITMATLFGLASASSHGKGLARRAGNRGRNRAGLFGLAAAGALLGACAAGYAWLALAVVLRPEVIIGCAVLGAAAGVSLGQAVRSRAVRSRRGRSPAPRSRAIGSPVLPARAAR